MKYIIAALFFFLIISTANAITFTDNFDTYSGNFVVISNTDSNSVWTNTANVKNKTLVTEIDTNKIRDSNFGIKIDSNKLINPGDPTVGITTSFTAIDLSSFKDTGRLYYWIYIDKNAGAFSNAGLDSYLSSNAGVDYAFNREFTAVGNQALMIGWNLIPFDINSPDINGGTVNWSAINSFIFNTNEDVGSPDRNVVLNKVWIEKQNNSFGGNWIPFYTSGSPRGWATVDRNNVSGNYYMNLVNTNQVTFVQAARWIIPSISNPAVTVTDYNLDLRVDFQLNDVNTSMGHIFDFNGQANYSSIYVNDQNYPSVKVGVETFVAATRTFSESSYIIDRNKWYTLRGTVDGNTVNIYINGNLAHTGTIPNRRLGNIGLETKTNKGFFDNYSASLTQFTPTPDSVVDFDETITFRTFSDIAGLIGFVGLLLVLGLVIAVAATIYSQNNGTEINVPQFQTNDLILLALGLVFIIILSFVAIRVVALG